MTSVDKDVTNWGTNGDRITFGKAWSDGPFTIYSSIVLEAVTGRHCLEVLVYFSTYLSILTSTTTSQNHSQVKIRKIGQLETRNPSNRNNQVLN